MSILICPSCETVGEGPYPPGPDYYCTACGSTKIPDADKQAEAERRFWAGYWLTIGLLNKEKRRKRKEGNAD